jgi:hypothetical protein
MDHFTKIHEYQDKTIHSRLALVARQVYTFYVLITIAHSCMTNEIKASKATLYLALVATSLAILLFAWYTLQTTPRTLSS